MSLPVAVLAGGLAKVRQLAGLRPDGGFSRRLHRGEIRHPNPSLHLDPI